MTFSMEEAEELVSMLEDQPDKDTGDLVAGDVSWATVRKLTEMRSDRMKEWQGLPVPVPGISLRLCRGHFMEDRVRAWDLDLPVGDAEFRCSDKDVDEGRVRNEWYCRRIGKYVIIYERADGTIENLSYWRSPDCSMDRLNFWLMTIGASDAWDWDAERKAKKKLRDMITPRAYRHYDLTGSFFETSPRSGLTYVFRKLRPTIAMSPRPSEAMRKRGSESMRCLCTLCMHPIGYYNGTWAGCMVPTDDVIAHLSFMRADEARYWGVANQHPPSAPESGL